MRLSQCNRKPHNARVEKIMSKTNDASRELTEDQLEQVSGGKPSAARDRPVEYLVMTLKDVIIT